VLGLLVAVSLSTAACSARSAPSAGFWFADRSFTLPADCVTKLDGPLSAEDIDVIENRSREELDQAFSGFNIHITDRQDAHWRVSVVKSVTVHQMQPVAGGSLELGSLGGSGSVGFVFLAELAVRHARDNASRGDMLDGIGRGIGAAAAHEIAHQILGGAMRDDRTQTDSYEYFSADRASQYFGTLHWTAARPLLQQRLGK
jgi:hypothetical protein